LNRQNAGAASTKVAVTVGVNAQLISGKEIENISFSWKVYEVKKVKRDKPFP
jgi:hypothetical protein